MSFIDTFLKYHNAGIKWVCPQCKQTMSAVMEGCVNHCKVTRPFDIEEVVSFVYFDGVEERFKTL